MICNISMIYEHYTFLSIIKKRILIDSFEAKYKYLLPKSCNEISHRKCHTIIYGAQNN